MTLNGWLANEKQYSTRALVKKTQEPGHLPRRIPKRPQKSPSCIFFNSRWPPPGNAIFEKEGYTLIPHLCS